VVERGRQSENGRMWRRGGGGGGGGGERRWEGFHPKCDASVCVAKDGVSSIKRCVQNNFADVHRQQVKPRQHRHLLPLLHPKPPPLVEGCCRVCTTPREEMPVVTCSSLGTACNPPRPPRNLRQVIERFHGYALTIDDQPVIVSPANSPAPSPAAAGSSQAKGEGPASTFPDVDAA